MGVKLDPKLIWILHNYTIHTDESSQNYKHGQHVHSSIEWTQVTHARGFSSNNIVEVAATWNHAKCTPSNTSKFIIKAPTKRVHVQYITHFGVRNMRHQPGFNTLLSILVYPLPSPTNTPTPYTHPTPPPSLLGSVVGVRGMDQYGLINVQRRSKSYTSCSSIQ